MQENVWGMVGEKSREDVTDLQERRNLRTFGTMEKFGIIGNPVAGSMSPRLFAAAYNGRWPYELIEGADFDASWARFLREFKGINVTAPFKEDAFRAADNVAPAARRIGAVNLAVKTPWGVEAYNTDYEGVRLALAEAGIRPATKQAPNGNTALTAKCDVPAGKVAPTMEFSEPGREPGSTGMTASLDRTALVTGCGRAERTALVTWCGGIDRAALITGRGGVERTALVVGCGGAGRAAAAAAVDAGMRLLLHNRTRGRAEALAEVFGGMVVEDFTAAVRAADVIIYTVPQATEELLRLREEDFAAAEGWKSAFTAEGRQDAVATDGKQSTFTAEWRQDAGAPNGKQDAVAPDGMRRGKIVLEANYKTPAFTGALLERLERAGGRYVPGRRWLLYQAVAGYALFTGEEPDKERIMNAL